MIATTGCWNQAIAAGCTERASQPSTAVSIGQPSVATGPIETVPSDIAETASGLSMPQAPRSLMWRTRWM